MKKLANLNGAKMLSKNQQKSINGGGSKCATNICQFLPNGAGCAPGRCCSHGCCRPNPNPTWECLAIIDDRK